MFSKATFGASVARHYLLGFKRVFALLRDQPQAGALDEELGIGVRTFLYQSHRIFYRIGDDSVEVLRILQGARNAFGQLRG